MFDNRSPTSPPLPLPETDGPVFKMRPKSVEADNGASITLTCDVVGNPMPDILWIHEPNDKVNVNAQPLPDTKQSIGNVNRTD